MRIDVAGIVDDTDQGRLGPPRCIVWIPASLMKRHSINCGDVVYMTSNGVESEGWLFMLSHDNGAYFS
jgi:hypothetical protein